MRFRVILIFLFLLAGSALAQDKTERVKGRGVYAELFGNGILYSFNYDQRFEQRLDGLGFRVGASYVAVDGDGVATFPVGLNYLLGKNGKYFELGVGGTYGIGFDSSNTFASGDDRTTDDEFIGTMTIGYRREPTDGGFLFRVALTPFFGNGVFWPFFAGVSFGYAF